SGRRTMRGAGLVAYGRSLRATDCHAGPVLFPAARHRRIPVHLPGRRTARLTRPPARGPAIVRVFQQHDDDPGRSAVSGDDGKLQVEITEVYVACYTKLFHVCYLGIPLFAWYTDEAQREKETVDQRT